MTESGTKKCPGCRDGVMTSNPGRLDQCADTYLPAIVWFCPHCLREETLPDLTPDAEGHVWRTYGNYASVKGKS